MVTPQNFVHRFKVRMTNNLSEKWSTIERLNSTANVFCQPFPILPQPQPPSPPTPPPLLPLTSVGTRSHFLGMTPHYNRKFSSLIFFFQRDRVESFVSKVNGAMRVRHELEKLKATAERIQNNYNVVEAVNEEMDKVLISLVFLSYSC